MKPKCKLCKKREAKDLVFCEFCLDKKRRDKTFQKRISIIIEKSIPRYSITKSKEKIKLP